MLQTMNEANLRHRRGKPIPQITVAGEPTPYSTEVTPYGYEVTPYEPPYEEHYDEEPYQGSYETVPYDPSYNQAYEQQAYEQGYEPAYEQEYDPGYDAAIQYDPALEPQRALPAPAPYETEPAYEPTYEPAYEDEYDQHYDPLYEPPRSLPAPTPQRSLPAPEPPAAEATPSKSPRRQAAKQKRSDDGQEIVWKRFLYPVNTIVGVTMMVIASYKIASFLELLHENELWFTNIREIEREISFRTEQGLYYSYYKQLINSPSFQSGIGQLIADNTTEQGRTINILSKFNIYQEVFLSAVYRLFNLQKYIQPIFFYTKTVFFLHGIYMSALYITAWMLSGSWLSGALAVCLYIFNRNDSTRVHYTIPLRESFSLPFLFCQMCVVTYTLRPKLNRRKYVWSLVATAIFTFLYCVTWQFAPFIMLFQCITLFGLAVTSVAPKMKIIKLLIIHGASLLTVCMMQFGQPLILGSFVLSFLPSAILILSVQEVCPCKGMLSNIGRVAFRCLFAITITITLNVFMKALLCVEADEHILKFAKAKLGLENPRDFESRLYLCNGAFQLLDAGSYHRMCSGLILLIYPTVEFIYLAALVVAVLLKWGNLLVKRDCIIDQQLLMENRPDLAYHVVFTIFLAMMAVSTLRMKGLWVPHMCILASVGVADVRLWRTVIGWFTTQINCVRHIATTLIMILLIYRSLPAVKEELEDLKEFWDPDTVELMEWINHESPPTAAFAGSMQLLAGVKLCTGRPITNHPHFEDKWLRDRTKQVYQIYARQPPAYVYKVLKEMDATFIIVEDSLCLATSRDRCRLPDLMDLHNGHVPDDGHQEPGLRFTQVPRFCDKVRYGEEEYSRYFQMVFINKTFRVYKLT